MSNPTLDNLFTTLPAGAAVGAALGSRADSGDGFGDILKHAGQGTSINTANDPGAQRDDQNLSNSSQQADDDRLPIGHWNHDTNDLQARDSSTNASSAGDYTDHWRPSHSSNSHTEPSRPSTSSANDHSRDNSQNDVSNRSNADRTDDRTTNRPAKTDDGKNRQSNDDNGPSKPPAGDNASRAAGSNNAGPVKPPPTTKDAKKEAAEVAEKTETADGQQKQAATAEQIKAASTAGDQTIDSAPTGAELPGSVNELSLGTKALVGGAAQDKADPAAKASAAKTSEAKACNATATQTQQQEDANLAAAQLGQQPANGAAPNAASASVGSQLASSGKQAGKANCEIGNDKGTPPIRPLGSNDENSDQSQQANSVEASWASAIAQATALSAGTLQLQVPFAATTENKSTESKSSSSTDAVANQPAALPTDRAAANAPAAGNNQASVANTAAKLSTDDRNGQAVIGPPHVAASQIDQVRFVQRVARAFRTADEQGGEIRLRLSPPELGSLKVEVAIRNGVMTARLEAETTTARSLLVDNLPTLRARLADQNIKIERFDVDLKQDGRGDGSANSPSDSGGSRQGPWRDQTTARTGLSGNPLGVGTTTGTPGTRTNDGQINVVI